MTAPGLCSGCGLTLVALAGVNLAKVPVLLWRRKVLDWVEVELGLKIICEAGKRRGRKEIRVKPPILNQRPVVISIRVVVDAAQTQKKRKEDRKKSVHHFEKASGSLPSDEDPYDKVP